MAGFNHERLSMKNILTASHLIRRASVLVLSMALFACAHQAAGPAASLNIADPAVMTKTKQEQITADQALQLLKDGNARFVSGHVKWRDLPA